MPVTAKLSKAFYDKMGDQVTTELVEWFNSVDSTYRADLRELNESNFARFDAKVEQRFAQSEAQIDRRFALIDVKFAQLEAKFEQRFVQLEAKFEQRCAQLEALFERRLGEQTRWLVAAWVTVLAALMGLYLRR